MRKQILALMLSLSMVTILAGCNGSSSEGIIKDAEGKTKKTELAKGSVELAEYKGIEVYEKEIEVEDSEVKKQIDSMLSSAQTSNIVTTGKVGKTDIANINYTGTVKVDGQDYAFEGGSGEKKDVNISTEKSSDTSTYIDGFVDGLVGKKVGDTFKLNLKFPKDYETKSTDANGKELILAEKEVTYTVTINSRAVIPELTDEFVNKNYKKEYNVKTVKGLEEYVTKQLRQSKIINAVWQNYQKDCKVNEYDEDEQESLTNTYNDAYASYLNSKYSTNLDTYLEACSMSSSEWNKQVTEKIQTTMKEAMIITAIAIQENIYNSEADYNKKMLKIAKSNGVKTVEEIEQQLSYYYSNYYMQPLCFNSVAFGQDVYEVVADNVKVLKGERPTEEPTTNAEATTNAETTK